MMVPCEPKHVGAAFVRLFYASTFFDQCCAHHQDVRIVLYSIWYRHIIGSILAINQLNAQNLVL